MANVLDRQITLDGPRNAVVKLTGILDSADALEQPAVSLDDFTNNDPNLYLIGYRFDVIEWSMSQGLEIQIAWDGANPQQVYPIAGRGRIVAKNYGGFVPDFTRPGYSGNIILYTNNFNLAPGGIQNFTVILELVKLYTRKKGALTP